jgi:hypothetical protein
VAHRLPLAHTGLKSEVQMVLNVRVLAVGCLVLVSTLTPGQVLTKSNSGLTTGEAIQVTGHASGSVPFQSLSSLSAQDVNGDGKVDLLVTGPDPTGTSQTVTTTLLRNSGNQNFTQVVGNNSSYCLPAYSYPTAGNEVPPFCTLADLNGDGLPDKIFVGEYPNASNPAEVDYPYVKVAYATGPGMWASPVKYGIGGKGLYIASVAVGDFNGDGRTDIAVLQLSQNPTGYPPYVYGFVYVLWGKPDGTCSISHGYATNVANYAGQGSEDLVDFFPDMQIAALDLNGDGKSDIIAYSGQFGAMSVMLGTGNGLTAGSLIAFDFEFGEKFLAADLNKDGFGDLVIQESSRVDPQSRVHVFSGGGQGSQNFGWFSRDQALSLNEYDPLVTGIATGDFNRDGLIDLAITTNSNLNIFLQQPDGSFGSPKQYALNAAGGFLAVADFDGDGKLDVALDGGNPIAILYGDGHGSFNGPTVSSNFIAGGVFDGFDVTTADFNKDGKADVITTIPGGCNQGVCSSVVNLFTGSGQGWFQPQKNYTVPMNASVVATGDLNGDGQTDIVALNTYGNNPPGLPDTGVLQGRANGTFAAGKSYVLGLSGVDLYLRDVNNDGKLDMITDAGVALGNGDGTFGAVIAFPYGYETGCAICQNMAVGDFNNDGRLDVLFSQNGVHVMLGDGTGHFAIKTSYSPQCAEFCGAPILAVGDLNGDGKLDFVAGIAAGQGSGIAVYLGNGDGTFQAGEADAIAPSASASYGVQIESVTIHDMNGDGVPDLIVATTNGLAVFLGKGGGHFTAPLVFAAPAGSFGTSAFAIADYDSNGTPDLVVPVFNGVARLLNTGYSTWPKVSSLPAPSPFRGMSP